MIFAELSEISSYSLYFLPRKNLIYAPLLKHLKYQTALQYRILPTTNVTGNKIYEYTQQTKPLSTEFKNVIPDEVVFFDGFCI